VSEAGPVQRVRLTFSKGEEVKYISHLAVMRAWERIIRRAELPVAYSHGFNPRPKLAFASALSVGYTGRAEVLDVELGRQVELRAILKRLAPQLPEGFTVAAIQEMPLRAPSAQSQLRYAVYRVSLDAQLPADVLQAGLDRLLSAAELPRQRTVKGKVRRYDLRPLVCELWYHSSRGGGHVLGMVLANSSTGTGRVDEVAGELGVLEDLRAVERTQLLFEGEPVDPDSIKRSFFEGG
jgi:radical SAM-linked protein